MAARCRALFFRLGRSPSRPSSPAGQSPTGFSVRGIRDAHDLAPKESNLRDMREESDEAQRRDVAERRNIRTGIVQLKGDHDAFDRDYFVRLTPGEKMTMVGAMFAQQWLSKGGDAEQLRLRRDIAKLQRRRR